jgi:hypothetical protein
MSESLSADKVDKAPSSSWLARSWSVLSFLESGVAFQKNIIRIIVEMLFVPFSWLISYLVWHYSQPSAKDTEEKSQDGIENYSLPPYSIWWYILAFLFGTTIPALIGYFLMPVALFGPDWAWPVLRTFLGLLSFSLITNIPTMLLMYLLTPVAIAERRHTLVSEIENRHEQMVAALKAHDAATLDGFHDSYWRMDQILGHKVWAAERTYKFLSRIVQNEAGKKAKWQMVNFLSRLADNHIFPEEDSGYFKITTESSGTWHISEYSDFLSDNIVHASKEIRWLVDPKDFVEYLIPYCVTYLLGSIAAGKVGLPLNRVWNEVTPFSYEYLFAPVINRACPAYCEDEITRKYLSKLVYDHHSRRERANGSHAREHGIGTITESSILLKQDRTVGWWHDLHDIVFPGIAYFGNEVVKKEGVPADKVILDGFSKLYDNWIRRAFPHIDSFRRTSAERACRHLLLPPAETIQKALQKVADDLSSTIFNETSELAGLSKEKRLKVVRMAFRLFGELSGGTSRVNVCAFKGSTTDGAIRSFDVGLYDGKFLVRSIAYGDFRIVEWYYLFQRSAKDNLLPSEIRSLIDVLEYKTTTRLYTLIKDTTLWKAGYENIESEYDLLADVLTELIGSKWQNG